MGAPLAAFRRAGADPPFGDPARDHGAAMEGYYWRLVHPRDGWVIVWLCGVCRSAGRSWATVALAAHPCGFLEHRTVEPATADGERFGARAGDAFRGSMHELRVRMDDGWVDARLRPRVTWPRRAFGALGPAHIVPGLPQYWHPVVLAADVEGEACIGGRRVRLDGARAYAEKNWGPGFPGRWWWGHADAFPGADIGVAFAGGRLTLLGGSVAPTAVVVRVEERVVRFAPPLARARVSVGAHGWRIQMRAPRHRLELEGEAGPSEPHELPVPDVAAQRVEIRSHHLLAGRLRLRVQRGGRELIDAVSPLAGLELGDPPSGRREWPPPAGRPR